MLRQLALLGVIMLSVLAAYAGVLGVWWGMSIEAACFFCSMAGYMMALPPPSAGVQDPRLPHFWEDE